MHLKAEDDVGLAVLGLDDIPARSVDPVEAGTAHEAGALAPPSRIEAGNPLAADADRTRSRTWIVVQRDRSEGEGDSRQVPHEPLLAAGPLA
jgi:hypothetical protein